jgi:hypothetical protein
MSNHLKAFKIKRILVGIAVKGEEDVTHTLEVAYHPNQ